MRSSLILLLLLWSAANLSGQDQELMDSLRTDLDTHQKGDTLRFKTLSKLWLATLNNDLLSSAGFARQIIREAKTANDEEWTAVGNRVLGINLDYMGEGDSALFYYALARPYYRQTNNLRQSGVLLFNTAIIHQGAGRYDSAKHYLILADSCFANPKYLRQRSAVNKLTATIVREQGDEAEAVKYATTAFELAREAGDSARMADAEQEIAFAYQALNDFSTAAEYLQNTYEYYARTNDDYFATVSLTNLATCYQVLNDFDKALEYGELGMGYIERGGMGDLEIDIRNVLGNVYWSVEEYTKAEEQFIRAEAILRDSSQRRMRGEILTYLAGVQMNLNKLAEARRNGLEALEIVNEQGRMELSHKGYGQLAIIARKRGDYEKAYDYMLLRQGFQDSLYRKEQSDKVAELTLLFEKEKKDRLISEQKGQLALLESQAKVDRLQKTALGLGLAALLFLLVAGAYSYQQRGKRQQLEKDQLKRIQYDAFGRMVGKTLGNDSEETIAFDPLTQRPARLSVRTDGSPLQELSLTYDVVGNLEISEQSAASVDGLGGSHRQQFVYDPLHRLTEATGSYQLADGEESFSYFIDHDDLYNQSRRELARQKKGNQTCSVASISA